MKAAVVATSAKLTLPCTTTLRTAPKTLLFGACANHLVGGHQKPRSKPKTLLRVFDLLLAADIRCEAEIFQHALKPDLRRACAEDRHQGWRSWSAVRDEVCFCCDCARGRFWGDKSVAVQETQPTRTGMATLAQDGGLRSLWAAWSARSPICWPTCRIRIWCDWCRCVLRS